MAKATTQQYARSNFILAIFEQQEWWRVVFGFTCFVLIIVGFKWLVEGDESRIGWAKI